MTVTILVQAQDMLQKGWVEYGALGVLVIALIWLLQLVLTKLPTIIENNTKAMTELNASLHGKIVDCPIQSDPTLHAWWRAIITNSVEEYQKEQRHVE